MIFWPTLWDRKNLWWIFYGAMQKSNCGNNEDGELSLLPHLALKVRGPQFSSVHLTTAQLEPYFCIPLNSVMALNHAYRDKVFQDFLFHAMFLIIFRAASFLTRMGIAMYWECPYCGTSFFHGEGRWTKYLPINARMFIFTERWKEILMQSLQNDQKRR